MMHVHDLHPSFRPHGGGASLDLLIWLATDVGPTLAAWLAIVPPWPVALLLLVGLVGVVAWRVGQRPSPHRRIDGINPPVGVELSFVGLAFVLGFWPAYAYVHALVRPTCGSALGTFAGVAADAMLVFALAAWYWHAQGRVMQGAAQQEALRLLSTRPERRPDSPIS